MTMEKITIVAETWSKQESGSLAYFEIVNYSENQFDNIDPTWLEFSDFKPNSEKVNI
jgi:hypothetical protein